ncbi:dihydroneopterin aldolase [Gloeocapsa sp. PCC 73106]|uniref:dihydroneopterin aldolase n=1 Tax=Gloeocapsa sp. PCC 73106 TaxID=102232 RepID=UPI0002AC74D1|nr:dihydroneopterin aldolase [Gloeocapsa sp. PCC 73106]ELR99959.1 dihydroneopterin aldolase [Gloeocapsa sp. PCC 73106]
MDRIKIKDIRAYGYTGFLTEEQILGQWFRVDLTLWLDLTEASVSDRICDTLDYRQAISIVKGQITTAKFALVEKLAGAIATEILELTPVKKVRVQLSKLAPPIPDFSGTITIDLIKKIGF